MIKALDDFARMGGSRRYIYADSRKLRCPNASS